jgi:hypothetical protein
VCKVLLTSQLAGVTIHNSGFATSSKNCRCRLETVYTIVRYLVVQSIALLKPFMAFDSLPKEDFFLQK